MRFVSVSLFGCLAAFVLVAVSQAMLNPTAPVVTTFVQEFQSSGLQPSTIPGTPTDHISSSVACLGEGYSVVVWEARLSSTSSEIVGKLFRPPIAQQMVNSFDGAWALPTEAELRISSDSNAQSRPQVIALNNGAGSSRSAFAVVWQTGLDGSDAGISARVFSSSGSALTSVFQVNTFSSSTQETPSVAALNNNAFVVVWQSWQQAGMSKYYDVYGQVVGSDGSKIGPEFLINSDTSGLQIFPTVSPLKSAQGVHTGFVVVWSSLSSVISPFSSIYGQRFDLVGNKIGTQFRIDVPTASTDQRSTSVLGLQGGGYFVSWMRSRSSLQNYETVEQGYDVVGQQFGADGRIVYPSTSGVSSYSTLTSDSLTSLSNFTTGDPRYGLVSSSSTLASSSQFVAVSWTRGASDSDVYFQILSDRVNETTSVAIPLSRVLPEEHQANTLGAQGETNTRPSMCFLNTSLSTDTEHVVVTWTKTLSAAISSTGVETSNVYAKVLQLSNTCPARRIVRWSDITNRFERQRTVYLASDSPMTINMSTNPSDPIIVSSLQAKPIGQCGDVEIIVNNLIVRPSNVNCSAGQFINETGSTCETCSTGTYSPDGGFTFCWTCESGNVTSDGSECINLPVPTSNVTSPTGTGTGSGAGGLGTGTSSSTGLGAGTSSSGLGVGTSSSSSTGLGVGTSSSSSSSSTSSVTLDAFSPSKWRVKQDVVIRNPTGSDILGQQVKLVLDTRGIVAEDAAGGGNSDGRDLVVIKQTSSAVVTSTTAPSLSHYESAGSGGSYFHRFRRAARPTVLATTPITYDVLNHFVLSGWNTTNTVLFTRVDLEANKNITLSLYLGNSQWQSLQPSPLSQLQAKGEAVFEFFESFPTSTLSSARWTVTDLSAPDTATIEDNNDYKNNLVIRNFKAGGLVQLRSNVQFTHAVAVTVVRKSNSNSGLHVVALGPQASQCGANDCTFAKYQVNTDSCVSSTLVQATLPTSPTEQGCGNTDVVRTDDGLYHSIEVELLESGAKVRIDHNDAGVVTRSFAATSTIAKGIRVFLNHRSNGAKTNDAESLYRFVMVSKTTSVPIPVLGVGAVEAVVAPCASTSCVNGVCIEVNPTQANCTCFEGYTGKSCEIPLESKSSATWPFIVGGVVGVVFLAGLLYLYKKRKDSPPKNEDDPPPPEYMHVVTLLLAVSYVLSVVPFLLDLFADDLFTELTLYIVACVGPVFVNMFFLFRWINEFIKVPRFRQWMDKHGSLANAIILFSSLTNLDCMMIINSNLPFHTFFQARLNPNAVALLQFYSIFGTVPFELCRMAVQVMTRVSLGQWTALAAINMAVSILSLVFSIVTRILGKWLRDARPDLYYISNKGDDNVEVDFDAGDSLIPLVVDPDVKHGKSKVRYNGSHFVVDEKDAPPNLDDELGRLEHRLKQTLQNIDSLFKDLEQLSAANEFANAQKVRSSIKSNERKAGSLLEKIIRKRYEGYIEEFGWASRQVLKQLRKMLSITWMSGMHVDIQPTDTELELFDAVEANKKAMSRVMYTINEHITGSVKKLTAKRDMLLQRLLEQGTFISEDAFRQIYDELCHLWSSDAVKHAKIAQRKWVAHSKEWGFIETQEGKEQDIKRAKHIKYHGMVSVKKINRDGSARAYQAALDTRNELRNELNKLLDKCYDTCSALYRAGLPDAIADMSQFCYEEVQRAHNLARPGAKARSLDKYMQVTEHYLDKHRDEADAMRGSTNINVTDDEMGPGATRSGGCWPFGGASNQDSATNKPSKALVKAETMQQYTCAQLQDQLYYLNEVCHMSIGDLRRITPLSEKERAAQQFITICDQEERRATRWWLFEVASELHIMSEEAHTVLNPKYKRKSRPVQSKSTRSIKAKTKSKSRPKETSENTTNAYTHESSSDSDMHDTNMDTNNTVAPRSPPKHLTPLSEVRQIYHDTEGEPGVSELSFSEPGEPSEHRQKRKKRFVSRRRERKEEVDEYNDSDSSDSSVYGPGERPWPHRLPTANQGLQDPSSMVLFPRPPPESRSRLLAPSKSGQALRPNIHESSSGTRLPEFLKTTKKYHDEGADKPTYKPRRRRK